jgi:hypothetical protein
MDIQLSKLIGHKIIVMGPGLFDPGLANPASGANDKLESVKLVAVDATGIWIESEEALNRIVDRFRVKPSAPGLAFFIPFSRIETIIASFDPTPVA